MLENKLAYELRVASRNLDIFKFIKDMEIDKYSLVVAAGSDSTYHEVINGILARTDKRKIPIALVPNGTSNDLCTSLGIRSVDYALEYIKARITTRIDTIRCLMGIETEDNLPKDIKRLSLC